MNILPAVPVASADHQDKIKNLLLSLPWTSENFDLSFVTLDCGDVFCLYCLAFFEFGYSQNTTNEKHLTVHVHTAVQEKNYTLVNF